MKNSEVIKQIEKQLERKDLPEDLRKSLEDRKKILSTDKTVIKNG